MSFKSKDYKDVARKIVSIDLQSDKKMRRKSKVKTSKVQKKKPTKSSGRNEGLKSYAHLSLRDTSKKIFLPLSTKNKSSRNMDFSSTSGLESTLRSIKSAKKESAYTSKISQITKKTVMGRTVDSSTPANRQKT